MKEKHSYWPQIDIKSVNSDWWNEVMESTAPYNDHFSTQLSDANDFTIRAIVYVVTTKPHQEVAWYLEGSLQSDRLVQINQLLHSDTANDKQTGKEKLVELIEEFTSDMLI